MKTALRISAVIGIVLIALVIAFAVMRELKAREKAAFIADAHMQTVSVTVSGIERHALVHVPAGKDGKTPLPLVLMFHGMGGTAEASIMETGWVAKSDAAGFIVAFPEATRPDMSKPPKFGSNNQAWNDGSARFHAGELNIPDVALIAALLERLETMFAVDRQRVFATGFSNGASMVFRVGLELSERIAAIAPVSGAFWIDDSRLSQPVSLLYITGTKDPLNPMEGGTPKMASGSEFKGAPEKAKPPVRENARKWANLIGASPDPTPLSGTPDGVATFVHDGGRDGTEVIFTTIADHGHIWPGGRNLLPEFIVGKSSQRLNATDVIWEFFKSHPKRNPSP